MSLNVLPSISSIPSDHFRPEDEAPDGWEWTVKDDLGVFSHSTWLTADGEPVLVPIRYAECERCDGTGDDPWEEDEYGQPEVCCDCDGDGLDPDDYAFAFDWAVSKTTAMRLKALGTNDVAGLQWWKGGA